MKKKKMSKPHKFVAIMMIAVLLTASLWAMPMQAAASMDVFYNISSYNNAFSDSNSSNNGLFSLSKFLPSVSKAANPTRHNEFEHYNDHAMSKYKEISEYKKAIRKFVNSVKEFSEINKELKEAVKNGDAPEELIFKHKIAADDLSASYADVKSSLDNITILLERLVSEGKISDVILERHLDFIKEFDSESQKLLKAVKIYDAEDRDISALQVETLQEPSIDEIEKIDEVLRNATFRPKMIYPTELPHRPSTLKPPEPKVVNAEDVTIKTTLGLNVSHEPADYLKTSEYSATYNISEIQHLAWSLDHDPVQMFYYVRNNVDYEPYFGPMAGPEWTLKQEGGNSFDQASLLIALYRESGIPARYVYGTIDIPAEEAARWVRVKNATLAANMLASSGIPTTTIVSGGNITAIRVEHMWVEAYLPYQDFRGQIRSETGYAWIPLDPSFKTYTYVEGMGSPINMTWASDFLNDTLNTSTYNETEGWITGVNETFVVEEMEASANETLEDILADPELSNRTFMQLFGYWELNKEESNFLPSTLPYNVVSVLDVYSEIPDEYYHKIRFKISSIDYTVNSSEVAGKRVTVSFIPATAADEQLIEDAGGILNVTPYMVNMKPVLTIDGETVAEGSAITLGDTLTFTTEFTNDYLSDFSSTANTFTVGAYYAIVFDMGKVPSRLVEEHAANLNVTNYRLSLNETATTDEVVGELIYLNGLTYFYENDFFSETQSLPDHIRWYRPTPAQAITSVDLIVWYDWLGNPVDLDAGGMSIDVDRNVIAQAGEDSNVTTSFMHSTGMTGSTLEHGIFEQLYNVTSVSAMKILQEANNRGIPIYTINQTNVDEILPILQLPDSIKNWIRSDINAGRIVIVPKQEIQIEDWEGTGWIVTDPDTGAGAYYISGGLTGILAGGSFAKEVLDYIILFLKLVGLKGGKFGKFGIIGSALNILKQICISINVWLKKGFLHSLPLWLLMILYALFAIVGYFAVVWGGGLAAAMVFLVLGLMISYCFTLAYSAIMKKAKKIQKIIERTLEQFKFRLSITAQAKPEKSFVPTSSPFKAFNTQSDPITRGKEWLTNAQTPEGYWGYRSSVKHTSFAVMALSEQGYDVSTATAWIAEHQNPDGSFGDLESTCFAVWALSKAGIENENGTNFILSAQNPDGSWGDHLNTSLAIIALNYSGISISDDTTNWLLDAQNIDGGWGAPKSQTFDTALALKALNLTGVSAEENETKKGIAWLEYHQSADGGWVYEDSSALALDVLLLLNSSWNATSAVQWLLDRENPDNGWGIDRSQTYVTALVVSSLLKFDPSLAVNGTQWLLDNQNPDGGWGFSREYGSGFLRDTALAGDVMSSGSAANWISAQQKPDGGWENVDHTSRAVIFLSDMGYDTTNATDWLIDAQNPDGGWGLTENYTSGAWEIALAVKALSKKYYWTPEIINGLNWLLYHQNPDGGWGINESDPYITSVVIDSFLSAGISPIQPQLQNASAWLKNQSLNCTSDVAMRLLTLDKMGLLDSDTKEEGVQWLLDNQNEDGGWGSFKNHTSTPHHTALAVKALEAFYEMRSYTITLKSGWNLISVPLNLTSWELGNESLVGDPLNVKPKNSLTSIYRYNATSGLFEKCDHFDDWGWWQATGSESFTELEAGRGYWVMAKNDCNLTFTGTAPSDLNVTVKKGWNLIGWYSMEEALLGEESVVGDPLNVTPRNSLTSIYRYNTTSGLFEKCDHFDNWGWWPATGSESFTKLEPGRGYWVMAKNDCVWRHRI